MAQSSELKQINLNTFQEETDYKTIEKETFNIEDTEIDINSSAESIALDIDEDIATIQADTIRAVTNAVQNITACTGGAKPCNLDIETALNNTLESSGEEGASTIIGHRISLAECQLAADIAENISRDSRLVVTMGEELIEKILLAIRFLQSHVKAFSEKALEATERGTEHDYRAANFYCGIASKYESTIAALERKAKHIVISVNRVQTATNECQKYAELAEETTDETQEGRTKFAGCWWTYNGRAAIIVSLKKEHSALLMMKRIWNSVQDDIEYGERNRTVEHLDSEETPNCHNWDRNTKIAHIILSLIGLTLLSVAWIFRTGSISFSAILALGLLTTVCCVGYWFHKYYRFLKGRDIQRTSNETSIEKHENAFLENCERYLEIVRAHLLKYDIIVDSDAESDTDSAETAVIDDVSQC